MTRSSKLPLIVIASFIAIPLVVLLSGSLKTPVAECEISDLQVTVDRDGKKLTARDGDTYEITTGRDVFVSADIVVEPQPCDSKHLSLDWQFVVTSNLLVKLKAESPVRQVLQVTAVAISRSSDNNIIAVVVRDSHGNAQPLLRMYFKLSEESKP